MKNLTTLHVHFFLLIRLLLFEQSGFQDVVEPTPCFIHLIQYATQRAHFELHEVSLHILYFLPVALHTM